MADYTGLMPLPHTWKHEHSKLTIHLNLALRRIERHMVEFAGDNDFRWRRENNLLHVLAHLDKMAEGDRSEDHLLHAATRLLMELELREEQGR